ncbi:hypothetical protein A5625_10220 [Mycobacterium sp. 1465703.0]|nr:1-acyl-sn-glycerol-3-phosphate acyltransferase [Mycobacterium sp. 1465703.0]OBJ10837.1 hypothetical protein A5625_10220 [Mycobacterium sp. 1465703.0]
MTAVTNLRSTGAPAAVIWFNAIAGSTGARETTRELMRQNQTILVFPGGAREIAKSKGEEYHLNWRERCGFVRLAVENGYPIVPVGLVGGDDVYKSLVARDSALGRLCQTVSATMTGRADMMLSRSDKACSSDMDPYRELNPLAWRAAARPPGHQH